MLHGVQHGPHNLCLQGNVKGSSQALIHSGNKRTWKIWDHAAKSSWLAQHEDHFTSVHVFPVLCYPRLGNLRIPYLILELLHSTHQSGSHPIASFHFLIFNLFQVSACLFSVLWLFPLVAYSTHKKGFVFSTPSCGWWGMTMEVFSTAAVSSLIYTFLFLCLSSTTTIPPGLISKIHLNWTIVRELG